MDIQRFPDPEAVDRAVRADEPLIAVISFDGTNAAVSPVDNAPEHHVLLMETGHRDTDVDRYFRIVFDRSGADWTFVCPADYRDITFKDRRIAAFYKDGIGVISDFLLQMGYVAGINIPRRYRRHLEALNGDKYL